MVAITIKVTVIIQQEENWYVAKCVENIEESIKNLREALELSYEDTSPENINMPTFVITMEVAL